MYSPILPQEVLSKLRKKSDIQIAIAILVVKLDFDLGLMG